MNKTLSKKKTTKKHYLKVLSVINYECVCMCIHCTHTTVIKFLKNLSMLTYNLMLLVGESRKQFKMSWNCLAFSRHLPWDLLPFSLRLDLLQLLSQPCRGLPSTENYQFQELLYSRIYPFNPKIQKHCFYPFNLKQVLTSAQVTTCNERPR